MVHPTAHGLNTGSYRDSPGYMTETRVTFNKSRANDFTTAFKSKRLRVFSCSVLLIITYNQSYPSTHQPKVQACTLSKG